MLTLVRPYLSVLCGTLALVCEGVNDICGYFTISAIFFIVEFLIVYGTSVA